MQPNCLYIGITKQNCIVTERIQYINGHQNGYDTIFLYTRFIINLYLRDFHKTYILTEIDTNNHVLFLILF